MSQLSSEQNHINSVKARLGYIEFVIMIAVLMATNAIAIDIMLPAMGEIKRSLNVTGVNDHHYIIFCYLVGFGFSQVFLGPISDRFGRRIPIIISLILYSIASAACAFAPSFAGLLVLRAIQGVGAAATRVLTVSIVRDIYDGRKMAEVMSIVMMVFMIVPIIAPATGQAIMIFEHWQLIFLFMAVAGVIITFWVYFRLPETLYEKRPLTFSSVGTGLWVVISNRAALCYTLAFSVLLGSLFAALNTAEQIYNGIYGLGVWFPLAFATVATFQALSAFLNARFVGKYGMRRISHVLLMIFCFASFIWFIWSIIAGGNIPFVFYMILFTIIMFSFGGMGANFNSLAMEPLGKVAGTASSVFGFLQTVLGAGLGFIIGQQFNGSTIPIAAGFFILGSVAVILVLIAENGRLFNQSVHLINNDNISKKD
ncbi:multidrug effflux MFS transporter [Bartonella tamiae]|uniref:multidrug effflux MFS transporter n=1 Tax=Bartonella tamiae TaxID=373638 RepID=UPI00026E6BD8|nr:multidrug effflux MFS transporter [Bartonella tamiae]EJF94975.1 drug resistance transporter, Bcr/CflA subfamily [Bartonella tamiae Th307]